MNGVNVVVGLDSQLCGAQRLARHLPAEQPAAFGPGVGTPEDVTLDALEIEEPSEAVQ